MSMALQVEEARKSEGERTGKAHEDMARAKSELKRLEKELASLQVLLLAGTSQLSHHSFRSCIALLRMTAVVRLLDIVSTALQGLQMSHIPSMRDNHNEVSPCVSMSTRHGAHL